MNKLAASCLSCDDFGWLPEQGPKGWYGTEWRLMLDPTVTWVRCPDCQPSEAPLNRMQDCLALWLLRRMIAEITPNQRHGDWIQGSWQSCPAWQYGSEIVLIGPGDGNPHPWLMVSENGVMQDLSPRLCLYHLERLDIAPPPLNDA